jgi:hypothetical protein
MRYIYSYAYIRVKAYFELFLPVDVDNGWALRIDNLRARRRLMLTGEWAREFAKDWVGSWNAHDLEAILAHYADGVVLTSPVAARLLGDPSGNVRGKEGLRAYFSKGLEAFPNLTFELVDVMWGLSSVVLYYVNQRGTKTGEFMEVDTEGKVVRVVANYAG